MRWFLVLLVACGGGSGNPDANKDKPDIGFGLDDEHFFIDSCATVCAGSCVNLSQDPMHCGSCEHACNSGESCVASACVQAEQTQWTKSFGGADFGNSIAAVATNDNRDVFVTGTFSGTIDLGGGAMTSVGAGDILVASFTSTGGFRWAKHFGSTGNDQGAGLVVQGTSVYVIGEYFGSVDFGGGALTSKGNSDIVVLALDQSNGAFLSARTFGTANADTGLGIAVDLSGNLAIGGFFGTGTINLGGPTLTGQALDNAFVAVFDSSFASFWVRGLGDPSSGKISSVQALAYTPNGELVAVGVFDGTGDFGTGNLTAKDSDAFVAKFGPGGTSMWAHAFGGASYDSADHLAVDATGNVFAAGTFSGSVDFGTGAIPSAGSTDAFVVGFNVNGVTQVARRIGASGYSRIGGIATTSTGSVVAAARINGTLDLGMGALAPISHDDLLLTELGGTTAKWAKRYGGSDYSEPNAVDVGGNGVITVGGAFRGTIDVGTGTITGGSKDNGLLFSLTP